MDCQATRERKTERNPCPHRCIRTPPRASRQPAHQLRTYAVVERVAQSVPAHQRATQPARGKCVNLFQGHRRLTQCMYPLLNQALCWEYKSPVLLRRHRHPTRDRRMNCIHSRTSRLKKYLFLCNSGNPDTEQRASRRGPQENVQIARRGDNGSEVHCHGENAEQIQKPSGLTYENGPTVRPRSYSTGKPQTPTRTARDQGLVGKCPANGTQGGERGCQAPPQASKYAARSCSWAEASG